MGFFYRWNMDTIADCCKRIDPCEAVCLINNVMVDIAVGKFVKGYKVGDESFQFAEPSLSDLKALLTLFEARCEKLKGKSRRAKVQLIFGEHYAGRGGRSRCRCG